MAVQMEGRFTTSTYSTRILFATGLITAALARDAIGQQDQKLGTVTFPTSCNPNVQTEFNRGVAMLHSYWFLIARRKFETIAQQDPACAMAYWGVAMDLLGNTLATTRHQRRRKQPGTRWKRQGLPGRRRSVRSVLITSSGSIEGRPMLL
jgi:hypothetical protein